jgi:cation diffusion facilitator family transporter
MQKKVGVTPGKQLGAPLLGGGETHAGKCHSHNHEPGMCHGFEVMKTGEWVVAHGPIDIQFGGKKTDHEQRKRRSDMLILGSSAAVVASVMLLELIVGGMLRSLALLSDGTHYASDVAMYIWLMLSVWLSSGKEDLSSYSFGYHRAQVLGPVLALLLQYLAIGWLLFVAIRRLVSEPHTVDGPVITGVGTISLLANLGLLYLAPAPSTGHGHSHGVDGGHGDAVGVARLHMLGDLVQGSAVILTGLVSWVFPKTTWADPCSTFVYACVVIGSSWRVFRELVVTLMERAPLELDVRGLFDDLAKVKGVIDVHCCHVWALAPGKVAMSAHMHIEDDKHEEVLHAAQIVVKHKYGIAHSTLQISEDEDLA